MAWSTPRTWVSGELVTAAIMNSAIKANLDVLRGGGIAIASQTAQDILFASSSTAISRLAAGTSGYFLKTLSTGSAPVWAEVAATTPGGSDTQVQYNDGGSFGGDAAFYFNDSTDLLTVGGISTAQVDITAEGDLRLQDASGGQYVGLDAPTTVSTSYTLTFPAAIGSVDQLLTINNVDGTLQWATVAATAPGGSDTQVQFNNSSSFGGDAGLTYVSGTDTLICSGSIGIRVTPTAGALCIDAAETSDPTVRFENDQGTVDAAIDTWTSAANIQLWIGANEYLNGGSPARFNTSYDTAAIELNVDSGANINFRTGNGAVSSTRMTINEDGEVGIGTTTLDAPFTVATSGTSVAVLDGSNSATGPTLSFFHSKATGTVNTRIAEFLVYANDDASAKRQINRVYFYMTDPDSTQTDSSIAFLVCNGTAGNAATTGTLSSTGLWIDASDEAEKTWGDVAIKDLFVTDQQSEEDIERGSDGGSVCQRLARIQDGRYHRVGLPPWKDRVWSGGPSAQDMWKEFGLGHNPYLLGADGNAKHHIGIAPKNLAAVAWWAIQELCEENEALKARVTTLESAMG